MGFIDERQLARREGDWRKENELSDIIKKSAKSDRKKWLEDLAGSGSWKDVRYLRSPNKSFQGRLRNLQGDIVFSDQRAESMAEYFEKIQWRVRPSAILPDRPILWPQLEVDLGNITTAEVEKAVKKLKRNKAPGTDEIPPEFFKALATTPNGLKLIVDL